ncbi:MAG: 16S rRNA (guanine(527)-N(7))-methyltransferase RsmG [Kofleriaceae bacterium]
MTHLVKSIAALGISATAEAPLNRFIELFAKWNERINLSAARTREQLEEHVIDCLHAVEHLGAATRLIDVGSGGGFPAVIIAICSPSLGVTALEPVHKKYSFLRTAARELGLSNLEPLAMRVEDHELRNYDAASSRATLDLRAWMELGLSLVSPSGVVIGFEGSDIRSDLPAGFERHPYELADKQRAIIVCRRTV